jgi:hypothetical protein
MPPLSQSRPGTSLLISKRPVRFSLWPTRPGRVHHALQSLLFARDPWLLIGDAIRADCPKAKKPEALAYLEQAKDFFSAANVTQVHAARPLTLYYSFMNLVKAFCLTRGHRATFDRAQHGLCEKQTTGTKDLAGAFLTAFPSVPTNEPNNFAEFKSVLTGTGLTVNTNYQLPLLMPQIVPGHRLWALAANSDERFVALHDIRFYQDRATREVWLELIVVADDLSRLGVTHQDFLNDAGLSASFRAVDSQEVWKNRPLLRFEQITPVRYPANHPADILPSLISPLKNLLWSTVSIEPPYRRQYVYLAPPADRSLVLPQLLSIYAIMYYFGSITRYRPHQYDIMIQGSYGSWIQEFLNGQPLQFVYLMASEFMSQDVTKPAIL